LKTEYTEQEIKAETKKINDFFENAFNRDLVRNPQYQSILGIKDQNDQWNNLSDTFAQESHRLVLQDMKYLMDSIRFDALDNQAKISYKLFLQEDSDKVEAFKYRFYSYPVNTQEGPHTDIPTFLMNVHSIDNVKDAKDYISRLQKINILFDQLIWQLEKRESLHIILPKFAFPKVLDASYNVIKGQPFDSSNVKSPIWEDFTIKLSKLNISASQKDSLLNAASKALKLSVKPAYSRLNNYLETLSHKASDTVGAWSWPNGDVYYQYAIRHYTSTVMTPEQVYQLGLREVARIHKEIKHVMDTLGYTGTVQEFFKYVKNSPKYFYPNTEEGRRAYLKQNTDVIENMKYHLDEMFLTKPKADIKVKAVEKFREKSAGTAFYDQPAPDGSRPGYFYVNLIDMSQAPIYQIEALAYHEGIPGHHMQIAIAQELNSLPKFRKYGDLTAYVEGWGLYAERLPKEFGFYTDPIQDFGRLTMELLRAARLVVDPAIHYKHWTREQAIKYFLENTAEPPGECVNAIERYITWPGQATAYKIGMNKILELREKAKKELGKKYDVREFHDQVLNNGAVTLSLLEENITTWINSKK
jgi:uncharacterized protein (DUF885 family)